MLPYQGDPPKEILFRGFGSQLEPRYIVGTEPLDQ